MAGPSGRNRDPGYHLQNVAPPRCVPWRRLRFSKTSSRTRIIACVAGVSWSLSTFSALPNYQTPQTGNMRAHYLNVGQGSAVLLEFSCAAALIDTGGESNAQFDSTAALQTYLDAFFSRRTDLKRTLALVLITHAHIDHTRGLPMVLKNYTVSTYVDNGAETGSGGRQQKAAHAKAGAGMSWKAVTEPEVDTRTGLDLGALPGCKTQPIRFHAMWGNLQEGGEWTKTILNDQNDSSVVTQLKFGETAFLFMGDLEEDVHDNMLGFFCDKIGDACPALRSDVMHVAHHGSYNGTSPDIIAAISPRLFVISMGPPDRNAMWTAVAYGHPRKVAVDQMLSDANLDSRSPPIDVRLATKAGSKGSPTQGEFISAKIAKGLYATGWDGTVVISADAKHHLKIDTEGHP